MKNSQIYGLSMLGIGVLGSFSSLHAECPCSRGQSNVTYTTDNPYVTSQQMAMQPTTIAPAPTTFPMDMSGQQMPNMGSAYPAMPTAMYNDLTFYRTAREIPANKPPRVGMVDIKVTGAAEVKVYDTHPFREEDLVEGFKDKYDPNVWRFETKPLIPGIPHIYKIVVFDAHGATQSRYVRLLPGRVVDISF